jgi:hypothetical protein
MHSSLTCPNCARHLSRPPRAVFDADARPTRPVRRRVPSAPPSHITGPVPSHAAVGLAVAALFMLLLIGLFIFFALTPHSGPGFGALTKP